ncbi:diguanylate cyclase (GGDEF)-like protein [Actimicrobium sp. GrIS 1.19]|uniref:GGDEF domain-containing protein n=1 Tax=Actimicrobium sp. GrIS 1.19 TaxID=3071708 RepID=UPI002E04AA6D|nr:diguanylate cyclase (GGDEF)-like protein [Actimicrobium sp. GrIS 1.19]
MSTRSTFDWLDAPRAALRNVWSSTTFSGSALSAYAEPHITRDTRDGIALLSLVALLFLATAALLCSVFQLGTGYVYTYAVLTALALHIHLSAGRVAQVRALNLLGMLLLIVCGSSLVLLAQRSGQLHMMLLLSVAVLFMLVPVVPWGLREAGMTTGAIYLMFTASTWLSRTRFSALDLWVLQFLMLVAALIALALVSRALGLRKHDLTMRFGLEQAHLDMSELANRDHLTGAFNRRFLEQDFDRVVAAHHRAGLRSCFGLFDLDRFKAINDNFGHLHGDRVLQAMQQAFAGLAGPDEYLVRLGGDEFALLMCGDAVRQRIRAALDSLAGLAVGGAMPTVSLGLITFAPHTAIDIDQAYKLADALLYQAKRDGGNHVCEQAAALECD